MCPVSCYRTKKNECVPCHAISCYVVFVFSPLVTFPPLFSNTHLRDRVRLDFRYAKNVSIGSYATNSPLDFGAQVQRPLFFGCLITTVTPFAIAAPPSRRCTGCEQDTRVFRVRPPPPWCVLKGGRETTSRVSCRQWHHLKLPIVYVTLVWIFFRWCVTPCVPARSPTRTLNEQNMYLFSPHTSHCCLQTTRNNSSPPANAVHFLFASGTPSPPPPGLCCNSDSFHSHAPHPSIPNRSLGQNGATRMNIYWFRSRYHSTAC